MSYKAERNQLRSSFSLMVSNNSMWYPVHIPEIFTSGLSRISIGIFKAIILLILARLSVQCLHLFGPFWLCSLHRNKLINLVFIIHYVNSSKSSRLVFTSANTFSTKVVTSILSSSTSASTLDIFTPSASPSKLKRISPDSSVTSISHL